MTTLENDIAELIRKEARVELLARMDDTPVRGNALCSGDDDIDRECEDEIIARLDNGDEWAWASVWVTLYWKGYEASDHLGGCSYASEADFRTAGGYFDDMVSECVDQIVAQVLKDQSGEH